MYATSAPKQFQSHLDYDRRPGVRRKVVDGVENKVARSRPHSDDMGITLFLQACSDLNTETRVARFLRRYNIRKRGKTYEISIKYTKYS
jgi:hypothetical protein